MSINLVRDNENFTLKISNVGYFDVGGKFALKELGESIAEQLSDETKSRIKVSSKSNLIADRQVAEGLLAAINAEINKEEQTELLVEEEPIVIDESEELDSEEE